MAKFKNTFLVESARLQEWDYSKPWWYYVTINTKDHVEYFGKVEYGKMELNEIGDIVDNCWKEIPKHFINVELDYNVIMPNHVHGILVLNEDAVKKDKCRDVACNVSTKNNLFSEISPKINSLPVVVRSFKSAVSKRIHEVGYYDFSWQPRFYDRIIRDERELFNIRNYIYQNPLKRDLEKNQPENILDL